MNYSNFREKIYYTDKKELITYIIFSSFFLLAYYFSMKNLEVIFFNILFDLLKLFLLTCSVVAFILSCHLKALTKLQVYFIVQVFFLTICIILILLFHTQFQNIKNILRVIVYAGDYKIVNLYYAIHFYFIEKYRRILNNNNIYLETGVAFLGLCLFLIIKTMVGARLIAIFANIIAIILIYGAYKYTNLSIASFKKGIDIFDFNLVIFTIKVIFTLINYFIDINIFVSSLSMLQYAVFISSVLLVITHIVENNYSFVFKEIETNKKKLEEINNEIIKNNIKLQEKYERLNEKHRFFKEFIQRLSNPIVVINKNFRIFYCNDSFLSITNNKVLKNVINKRIENYLQFDYSIYEAVKKNKKIIITNIEKANKKYEAQLIYTEDEEFNYIISLNDLTEELMLIAMQEELKSIQSKELIRSNFLSNISHDIKVPVNIIHSATQLENVFVNKKDIDSIKKYNSISKKNCLTLSELTNNLIDISKIDTENLEANLEADNIVEFIEDYLLNISDYLKNNGIDLVFDTNEEEVIINFDKEMMKRILLNLVSNSLKFTNKGGCIFINIKSNEDSVIIEFKDNGIGMSEDFISKAFSKYTMENRKETKHGGYGIGLYVIYNLVKAQKGDIELKSTMGKGSAFIIRLNK
ncbi:sensor histidine kinase [Clostridium isatidis]|uniref:histidine kinase n=1 Tax=Clostridium isatidis TaxID=182773 RepID=A0A343JAF1_9CLOT|nr:HAMP domain-containing sensor histidine kinase [Clostridium isatidis]ASW42509.1 hypothetical protein BEN51_03150 [Clostridium isatidis]NLZ35744.1 HAMP domain-containing histidine kinase [Clostridiales bacterium]